jgi:hypothetical protein
MTDPSPTPGWYERVGVVVAALVVSAIAGVFAAYVYFAWMLRDA